MAYYLRIIKTLWFEGSEAEASVEVPLPPTQEGALDITAFALLVIGILRTDMTHLLTLITTLNPFTVLKYTFHILAASPFPALVAFCLLCFLPPLTFYMHGLDFFGLPRADIMHLSFVGLGLIVTT